MTTAADPDPTTTDPADPPADDRSAGEPPGRPGSDPDRPSSPRWPPSLRAVFAAAFALWGFAVAAGPLADNSFFTHLATGRLILEQGSVPSADPYSFTAAGEPWVVQSWLASLLYGLVDRGFGGVGLRILAGLLGMVIGLCVWRLTRPGRTLLPRLVAGAFPMVLAGFVWSPRPFLFGLACLAISLVAAEGGLDPRWLVPLSWFWVNTHGSFPLGLVALACLALGARLDGRADGGRRELRCLAWAALGTVLGAVSPVGPKMLLFPVELLGRAETLSKVIEWQSPNFSAGWTRIFLLQVVIGILVLVRRPSWRSALPLVVFTAAALLGLRNIALASIVLVPGIARGLSGLGSVTARERGPVAVAGLAAMAVAAVVTVVNVASAPAFDVSTFPVEAVAWMDQRGLVAQPDVDLATQDSVGNYLELLYGARARAFFDDRVDMYPKAVVDDYLTLHTGAPGWQAVLDRRGIDAIAWSRTAPLGQLLASSPDWRVGYLDGQTVVACRRGSVAEARCTS
ncbi:MAG: hypothetical protein U0Q07_09245 [Acidimicrobiales bacterium]